METELYETGFPEEFSVHLNGDDITAGIAGECKTCPYAIAVTRALAPYLKTGQWIEIDGDCVSVNQWLESEYSINDRLVRETIEEYIPDFGLGDIYRDFITNFDEEGIDHPAVFPHQMGFICEDMY